MKIARCAQAGTDNREDLRVCVFPAKDGISIAVHSSVSPLFDHHIEAAAREILAQYQIEACRMEIDDHSALDYAVRARVEAAVMCALED